MHDFTFVLNNRILVLSQFLHTGYNFTKVPFTSYILVWTSLKAPTSIIIRLPRYGKDLNCFTTVPFTVSTRYVLGFTLMLHALGYNIYTKTSL